MPGARHRIRRRDPSSHDGTYLPRNSFVGSPLHRVDTRLQKRIPLGGRRTLDGMLELFNLSIIGTTVRTRRRSTIPRTASRSTTPTWHMRRVRRSWGSD